MHSVQEYLNRQSTALLESLLEAFCDGREDMHTEVALTICEILARRDPRKPLVDEAFRKMCRMYLPR